MTRLISWIGWPAAIAVAAMFVWNEQYRLTDAPESMWYFSVLARWLNMHGFETPLRLSIGTAEMIAAMMLLSPPSRVAGAVLALLLTSGAIYIHLASPLGIDPFHDGGTRYTQSRLMFAAALFILYVELHSLFHVARGIAEREGDLRLAGDLRHKRGA